MIYRFANCLLDSRLRELSVGGDAVHVEPQVFDVLLHLIENRDRVVSRNDLVDIVWQGRSVSEATISARIFAARHAIGDTGAAQTAIRTLPRRGFRFVSPVESDAVGDEPPAPEKPQAPAAFGDFMAEAPMAAVESTAAPAPGRSRRRLALLAGTAVLVLLVAAGMMSLPALWMPQLEPASPERMAYPLPAKPSIAVLPFANLTSDAAQDLMGEGLTDGLINTLARNPSIFVIAHSSTSTYAGQPAATKRAAEELGVRYVVEGSIKRAGDRVLVAVQLVDAVSAKVVWAERYERIAGDLLTLEEEITAQIARSLDVRINFGTAQSSGDTRVLAAASAYLQGRNEYLKFRGAKNLRARQFYLRAIELDPNYAEAMIAVANTYFVEMLNAPPETWGSALSEIDRLQDRAARIAPGMPALFELRSMLALTRGDNDLALTEAEAMVALDPNGAESHYVLGQMHFFTGQYERAINSFVTAERINPNDRASYTAHLAFSHLALGEIDRAVAMLEAVAERFPDYATVHLYLAIAYQLAGRGREARQQVALLARAQPETTVRTVELLYSPLQDRQLADRLSDAARQAGFPG